MTESEFSRRLIAAHIHPDSASAAALHLVCVMNQSGYAVSKATGICESTISRARARLMRATPATNCPTCGHQLEE